MISRRALTPAEARELLRRLEPRGYRDEPMLAILETLRAIARQR